jgi:NAD(P)-dependent dehydrogenase (short-subunit alcohol dehydrogenase family)
LIEHRSILTITGRVLKVKSARFEDARVIVTGAGTGIGRGVALSFAQEGAAVALHYAHSKEGAQSAVDEILKRGGKAKAFEADFRKIEDVLRMIDEATSFLGGVDVLVNNAGITMNKPFEEVTAEQFDTLYHVNIRAMFFASQRVVPTMKKQEKGSIINISSVHAFAGMTEYSVYAGTKGAILAFTRVLALELSQMGIRVNAIAPGWILVENHWRIMGDIDEKKQGEAIPAGIIGKPSDVGELAKFLASDESRFIVGQTIVMDGGQLLILPLTGDFRDRRSGHWGVGYVNA